MLAPPAKRQRMARQAAKQAAWRGRVKAGEKVCRVTTRPRHRSKLVAAGYLDPRRRDDRDAIGAAIELCLDLLEGA